MFLFLFFFSKDSNQGFEKLKCNKFLINVEIFSEQRGFIILDTCLT